MGDMKYEPKDAEHGIMTGPCANCNGSLQIHIENDGDCAEGHLVGWVWNYGRLVATCSCGWQAPIQGTDAFDAASEAGDNHLRVQFRPMAATGGWSE